MALAYEPTSEVGGPFLNTFGPATQGITVTSFSSSGKNQDAITSVLNSIREALDTDTDCSSWLQGGGTTGSELISALVSNNSYGSGAFSVNSVAAFAGTVNADGSSTGVPDTAALTVNTNGAFFNATATGGGAFSVGTAGYAGGTLQAQATILIHELAHILGAPYFQPDFGNSDAGKANDGYVNAFCGRLIGGLK